MKKRCGSISKSTWLNIIILAVFTIYFLINANYEFIVYAVTIIVLILLIEKSDKLFQYKPIAKYGFSLWLFLHLAGGTFKFAGQRWYDTVLIPVLGEPFNLFRYDQILHTYTYIILTLLLYSVIKYLIKGKPNKIVLGVVVILTGVGLGAINEIIEFGTVVFFNSSGVGNYYNNALDLVFNLIGAIIAYIIILKTDLKNK